MDDRAASTGDHAPTVAVGLHVRLQPPEGLGADAGRRPPAARRGSCGAQRRGQRPWPRRR
eukprot:8526168-Alexandrium_andersonii.AAC.1